MGTAHLDYRISCSATDNRSSDNREPTVHVHVGMSQKGQKQVADIQSNPLTCNTCTAAVNKQSRRKQYNIGRAN